MVPRTPVLLTLSVLLGACRAETVGVVLPRGGRDTISQEDLQRDVWMLTQVPDRAALLGDAAVQVQHRFQQMHTRPGFDRSYTDSDGKSAHVVCAEKESPRGKRVLVIAEDNGASVAGGAIPVAVLVSLLKGVDTPAPPSRALFVCALLGEGARARFLSHPPLPLGDMDAVFLLGPLGDGQTLSATPTTLGDVPATALRLGGIPEVDVMESIDYRVLRDAVVAIFDHAMVNALP